MSIENIDPPTAHRLLAQEEGAIYLDVRSTTEFDQGHPDSAWNLPLMHMTPQGMAPNHEFEETAAAVLPKDALIAIGCRSGQRSMMACRVLQGLGFERLANVVGGFAGQVDPMTGDVTTSGWEACGLPTATEAHAGRSWEELRARALGRS